MYEWDATLYDRLGEPQLQLARDLLRHLPQKAGARLLDAGCGNGRVTQALLEAFPEASVLAVDSSESMLRQARERLQHYAGRVEFVQADLQTFVRPNYADCVFSNATLHWVADHTQLFSNLHTTLRPGGKLVAQFACCGERTRVFADKMETLMQTRSWAARFVGWQWSINTISAQREHQALAAAGFADIGVQEAYTPMQFTSNDLFAFMQNVVLHEHIARLTSSTDRAAFTHACIAAHAEIHGDGILGYESVICSAQRP